MANSTGSRVLWAGILIPPLLVLGAAGAMMTWPERIVGVMDAASRAWSSPPTAPAPSNRPFAPMVRTPMPPQAPEPAVTLRGTVRGPDGEPYRSGYRLSVARRGMWGASRLRNSFIDDNVDWSREFLDQPEFAVPLQFGETRVVVVAEGYAPAVLGPYSIQPSPPPAVDQPGAEGAAKGRDPREPEPVDVVLSPGFPHEVRVLGSGGEPIFGAAVTVGRIFEQSLVGVAMTARTDEEGRAVLPALSADPYDIAVSAHGFGLPDDSVEVRPEPGGSTTFVLERGPLPGVAVDEEGRPVADALLLLEAEVDERLDGRPGFREERIILAKSGADGRFTLPALHDHSVHLIRAEGPDGSLGYAPGVRRRHGEVRVTLRPARVVRGIAFPDAGGSPPYVAIKRSVTTGLPEPSRWEGSAWGRISRIRSVPVAPDGSFEYPAWASVETELIVGGVAVPVPWPPPDEPLRIGEPATEPAERTIRVQLRAEGGERPIAATMTLRLTNPPPERVHQDVARAVEIHEGAGEFRCLASESFRYDSDAIPGFWTAPGRIVGGGPAGDRLASARIFPAGAIAGRALDADGAPIAAGAKILAPFDPEWLRDVLWRDGQPAADSPATSAEEATTDGDGRFVIPAFPLDVASRLVVERGRYFAAGEEVRLASGDPRREVEFHLPRQAGASVRVVDPEGKPIPGARLSLSLRRSETEWRRWPFGETDADGRRAVDDLAEGEPNYSLRVDFAADFRPIVVPLTPGGPALELRAERGSVVEGRAVEAVTGWPIPGLVVFARSLDAPGPIEAEATTDADGRFRFSTLPAGRIRLEDRRGMSRLSPSSPIVRAGSAEPVLLRFIDLRDADPQPRPAPEF